VSDWQHLGGLCCLHHLILEDEGTMITCDVLNHSQNNTHPRRPKLSATPKWEHHVSHSTSSNI